MSQPVYIVPEPERERTNAFGSVMEDLRKRAGLSRNKLAGLVHVDPSYLTRCANGERTPPRRHIVDAIAVALRLSKSDHARLVTAAGYSSAMLEADERWNGCLRVVLDVVTDETLTVAERDDFQAAVTLMAKAWRRGR